MKKLKMGTTVMLIGFLKTLILLCLFGLGYFIGTIEKPGEFIREKANRLIPDKTVKPINIKEEIAREQAESAAAMAEAESEIPAEEEKDEE